jgi:hypothetical protein
MTPELESCHRAFAEIEIQRRQTVAKLDDWAPHQVSFRPEPGAWCAIEVLDHIVRAESGTITDLKAGLQHPHPLGPEQRTNVAALDRALRSDKRYRIPAGSASIRPEPETTLPEVLSRWEQARKELGRVLTELKPEDAVAGVFQHPFAGWMTFAEVLDHFSAHLYHHSFQLARLESASQGSVTPHA